MLDDLILGKTAKKCKEKVVCIDKVSGTEGGGTRAHKAKKIRLNRTGFYNLLNNSPSEYYTFLFLLIKSTIIGEATKMDE